MIPGIFSTYSTDENRVTSTIMAVIQALSLHRIERLLGALLDDSSFTLVNFKPQPSKGGAGVPDYEISCNCRILIETKIKPGSVNKDQLERHLKRFESVAQSEKKEYLLVLTPDKESPIQNMKSEKNMRWASFSNLNLAIDEILNEKQEVVSERESYLLRELQNMLVNENLLQPSKNVVVVAARSAWPLYQKLSVYICQSGRSFAPVDYIAFYAEKEIKPIAAKIISIQDNIIFDREREKDELTNIINSILDLGYLEDGSVAKLFILTEQENNNTIKLPFGIKNDLPSAFTMGQRYAELDSLMKARNTSDI